MAGVTGVVVGAIFLSSLYLQRVIGLSAVQTGLAFLPLAAVITGTAAVASKLLGRVNPRTMIAFGLVVMGARAAAGQQRRRPLVPRRCAAWLPCAGAGVGPMFVAISVAAMCDVQPSPD